MKLSVFFQKKKHLHLKTYYPICFSRKSCCPKNNSFKNINNIFIEKIYINYVFYFEMLCSFRKFSRKSFCLKTCYPLFSNVFFQTTSAIFMSDLLVLELSSYICSIFLFHTTLYRVFISSYYTKFKKYI